MAATKRPNETRGKRPRNSKSGRSNDFDPENGDRADPEELHQSVGHDFTQSGRDTEASGLQGLVGEVLPEFRVQAEATYEPGSRSAGRGHGAAREPVDAWYGSYGTRMSRVLASQGDQHHSAAEMVAEVIIDEDDRRRVHDTTSYPFGCICFLSIRARNGAHFVGTGWLADDRTVITAGHCVYLHQEGGWAAAIDVFPGRNGTDVPYRATATRAWTTRGWRESRSEPADYGAVRLDRSIDDVGTLGYAAEPDEALRNAICNVVGYPADKHKQMWGHARALLEARPETLVYDVDTYGGNSGGPVILVRDGEPVVIGIHNYGDYAGNRATRITRNVYMRIEDWVADN